MPGPSLGEITEPWIKHSSASTLVFAAVGLVAGIVILQAHGWYHQRLLPALGIAHPVGDTLGTLVILAVCYLGQRLLSLALFKDSMLGLRRAQAEVQRLGDRPG